MSFARPGAEAAQAAQTRGGLAYRPDIDGLRALAVAAVMLFHARIAGFGGGFVGVDVFFVISGFLITSIIRADQAKATFTLRHFYERRVRRIIPALVTVVAATVVLFTPLLLPGDLRGFGVSVAATLAFVSNVYFWRGSGYFGAAAEQLPLLHTWSLAVEEQFYLVFPLFMILAGRWGLRGQRAATVALGLGSFALATALVTINKPLPAFFLFPTRAWELLLGCAIALGMAPRIGSAALRTAMAVAGVALIGFAVAAYDADTPFPGVSALAPCLGAALLIVAGRDGAHGLMPALAARPVVLVGLMSYSLYLWHWPILAAWRYFAIRELTYPERFAALAIAAGLAYLSWRYVEKPFRSRALSFRKAAATLGAGTGALAAVAAALIVTQGLPGRFPPQVAAVNAAAGTMHRCGVTEYIPFGGYYGCPVNLPSRDPQEATVIIWGDSFAQMFVPALTEALAQTDGRGFMIPLNGCPPLPDRNLNESCRGVSAGNYQRILAHPARTVVVSMNWEAYAGAPYLTASGWVQDHEFDLVAPGVESMVRGLVEHGKQVVLVAPSPTPMYDVPSVVSRSVAYGRQMTAPVSQSRAAFEAKLAPVFALIARLDVLPGVEVIYPHRRMCVTGACPYLVDGQPIFADMRHLTRDYARTFSGEFQAALAPRP